MMTVCLIFNIMMLACNIGVCTYIKAISDNLDDKLDDLAMIEYKIHEVLE